VTAPILDAAREALLAGLSVVPPAEDGSKRPMGGWKRYQRERPTPEDLQQWYGGHSPRRGIGLVCGAVSGGLELLEFENAEAYAELVAAAKDAGLGELVERVEGGYLEESPGGGRHWLYRCREIGGNTKLARRPGPGGTVEVLIETRGEGGYVVCAPSAGKVHPSGRPYVLVAGGFSAIARISASERAELFRLAQTFDRMPQPQPERPAAGYRDHIDQAGGGPGGRPGDDLERRVSWAQILEPHGWRLLYRRSGLEAWQRPGKNGPGLSATIGHVRGEQGEPRLWVFSSSTPFEPERSYSKFAALAVLEHGGDYQAAARALAGRGYGQQWGGRASGPRSGRAGSTRARRRAWARLVKEELERLDQAEGDGLEPALERAARRYARLARSADERARLRRLLECEGTRRGLHADQVTRALARGFGACATTRGAA
jgi:putative DNA primase/helicase